MINIPYEIAFLIFLFVVYVAIKFITNVNNIINYIYIQSSSAYSLIFFVFFDLPIHWFF